MHDLRILVVVAAAALLGGAENARIDVDGIQAGIRLEHFSLIEDCQGKQSEGEWMPEEKNRSRFLYSGFRIPARTWTKVGFRFVPAGSGLVKLILRGPHKPKPGSAPDGPKKQLIPVPVVWDDVEAEGTKITNGDFEKGGGGGGGGGGGTLQELPAWTFSGKDDIAQVLTGEGVAHGGQRAVRCWHNTYVFQMIRVQKDRPVTITAWAWSETDPKG